MNANVRLLRPQDPVRFARLAEWTVDLPSNRLVRGEREIRPTPKAMAVLRQLMLAGGAPLTRNELLDRVWRDAYPTDDVLTHAITELRRALEDDPRVPRYIETIPKVGYRLLPPVEWLERLGDTAAPTVTDLPAPASESPPPETPPRSPRALFGALLALCALALLLPWIGMRRTDETAQPAAALTTLPKLAIKPVTADPNSEQFPAISPDGSTVAYAASIGDDGMSRIFIRGLNGSAPIALTHGKAEQEIYPVWSPDGTQVALVRQMENDCRIVVVAALGGYEREVTSCAPNLVDYFDWGPDGKSLVVMRYQREGKNAGGSAIQFVDLESGAVHYFDYDRNTNLPDVQPRVSPDGRRIAFRRGAVPYSDIYVVDATGGAVRQLTHLRAQLLGYDWAPDGRHIVFSSDHDGRQQLYLLDVDTRAISPLGVNGATFPTVSRKHPVVVYQQDNSDLNLLSLHIEANAKDTPQTLVASTRAEYWPAYSPRDDRLAFVSDRSGDAQLWMQPADGGAPFQLTHHTALDVALPSWSPDAHRVAYVVRGGGHSELYVVDVDSGQSRRVSDAGENVRFGSFSADGASLLYVSDRSGSWQLWRRPLGGGPGEVVGHQSAFTAADIGDGRIYLTHARDDGLYALDPANGEEARLTGAIRYWNMYAWQVVRGGVYYQAEPPKLPPGEPMGPALYFLPFSGGPPSIVRVFPNTVRTAYFSISADGRRAVTSVLARDDTDVMQVDLSPLLGSGG